MFLSVRIRFIFVDCPTTTLPVTIALAHFAKPQSSHQTQRPQNYLVESIIRCRGQHTGLRVATASPIPKGDQSGGRAGGDCQP